MTFFKIFNTSLLLLAISACSVNTEDSAIDEVNAIENKKNMIVLSDLKLVHFEEKKFETSNTPEDKYFHIKACFEKKLPRRKLSYETWEINGFTKKYESDPNGCVTWLETVKMDYSKTVGTFLRQRTFKLVNSNESLIVNIHIDQYKNKITKGIDSLSSGSSVSKEGLVTQESTKGKHLLASDPIKEAGDIQVLSRQDGHIPFVKYRIALQIPNRIANTYERLQGEPIQVRLVRIGTNASEEKTYTPVKELEGRQIKSAPYGSTNVAFDLDYNRYSPMRWIPYKLHILPLNPAFKNKGLTVDLCLKPWEGQKLSVYDASTFGSCPEPHDKKLLSKMPEIYFNHVAFKQLGQVESGYKLDEYLDISLRKKWRVTVRPYVNYWHNFESNNHYFPLLSGNFKIKMILMAYKKGDTLELTQDDIKNNNFEVIGFSETKARINKGNLIADLALDFPFQKWYRIYTRTFVAIQVLPLDEVENPYLKSGMAIIPFHAADRDYSIYVKSDHFTEILDPAINANKVNQSNFTENSASMNMGTITSVDKLENSDQIKNLPLSKKDSNNSKGKVVFQEINRKFFLDTKREVLIKTKLNNFFENTNTINSLEVGSGNKYKFTPEETALKFLNSSPAYNPMKRIYIDTGEGQNKWDQELSTFMGDETVTIDIGDPMVHLPPQEFTYPENDYNKLDYSTWSKDGLDRNAKQIFCHYYFRKGASQYHYFPNGRRSPIFRKNEMYTKCLNNPEIFIDVDTVSYINNVNKYKFSTGMEIRHNLDRRVYVFNSYNDRESMSGRVNFAFGFDKTNLGKIGAGKTAVATASKIAANPFTKFARGALGLFTANFGGYDVGRYWGLDHSVGLSDSVSKSESISLTGTKHDVEIDADVRKCTLVRFKLPSEIATSFTYYDKADFVSFTNMMDHQMNSLSLWAGFDLGKRNTPGEQFEEIAHQFTERKRKFFKAIMQRFEFCNKEVSKNEKVTESWYYLGSDLGFHSGTLDPLSLRHNPFMKLVRGTKNFDEVIDHLSHAIEAIFIDEAKNFTEKKNIGELIKEVYQEPKGGFSSSMADELISSVGLPGMMRRSVPTDNPYYRQVQRREEVYGKKAKITIGEDGHIETFEKEEKEDKSWWN